MNREREWAGGAARGDESIEHSVPQIHRVVRLLHDGVRRAFPGRLHVSDQPDGRPVPARRPLAVQRRVDVERAGRCPRLAAPATQRGAALVFELRRPGGGHRADPSHGDDRKPVPVHADDPALLRVQHLPVEDDGGLLRDRVARGHRPARVSRAGRIHRALHGVSRGARRVHQPPLPRRLAAGDGGVREPGYLPVQCVPGPHERQHRAAAQEAPGIGDARPGALAPV